MQTLGAINSVIFCEKKHQINVMINSPAMSTKSRKPHLLRKHIKRSSSLVSTQFLKIQTVLDCSKKIVTLHQTDSLN